MELRPITVLTGLNSTGKSSVIKSILFSLAAQDVTSRESMGRFDFSFDTIRNKYENAKELYVRIKTENSDTTVSQKQDEELNIKTVKGKDFDLKLEDNIYYLSANRCGYSEMPYMSPSYKLGSNGQFVFGTFEREKSKEVIPALRKCQDSNTLSVQVNFWLLYIMGIKLELQTEQVSAQQVRLSYKSDDLQNISPEELGAGVSYISQILIMCLRAKEKDVLMIENPEIHLHPAAQSRLADFFAFISKANIQLIIETHCNFMMDKLGYNVYKHNITNDSVVIYYKKGIVDDFEKIQFSSDGKYIPDFPTGFFDATMNELLEME